MSRIEGGCLCGQVRYKSEAAPIFQAACHCKNCQRQGGTAYSAVVGAPSAGLEVTGELSTYEDTGESGGTVLRKFCPRCGSPVLTETPARPGLTILKAGTLDDTSWYAPQLHIWTESAMACTVIPEGVAALPRNPG